MTKIEKIKPKDIKIGDTLVGKSGLKYKVLRVVCGVDPSRPYLFVEDEAGTKLEHDTSFAADADYMTREVV